LTVAALAEVVRGNSNFLLVSHTNPDGDSLGSQLALAFALHSLGKSAVLYSEDKIPDNYLFLLGKNQFVAELPAVEGFDVVFVLDCSELERVGKNYLEIGRAKTLLGIDHHHSHKDFCTLALVEETASSTAELTLEVIEELGVAITPAIANAIYAGILTDTGGFRYAATSSSTLGTAARMVKAGARPQWLSENIYESNDPAKIRLLAAVLNSLEFSEDGAIAWMTVLQSDLRACGALLEHTEGFSEFPRGVSGVQVALLFTEMEANYCKVSLRSKGDVDVAGVAAVFGGGGHINAAACRVQEGVETLRAKIIREAQKALVRRGC